MSELGPVLGSGQRAIAQIAVAKQRLQTPEATGLVTTEKTKTSRCVILRECYKKGCA
jgi:hypothetical protein